jgi:K+-transporting ATPase A subunit
MATRINALSNYWGSIMKYIDTQSIFMPFSVIEGVLFVQAGITR